VELTAYGASGAGFISGRSSESIECLFSAEAWSHPLTPWLSTPKTSWTRYKLNRPAFFRKYVKFFEHLDQQPENPPLDADMLKWLPLMFIVVSLVLSPVGAVIGRRLTQTALRLVVCSLQSRPCRRPWSSGEEKRAKRAGVGGFTLAVVSLRRTLFVEAL
jgi:hypothetical protein